ncbi:MAG: sulfite exporter TauE/SafE family protein [Sarcina sp.]
MSVILFALVIMCTYFIEGLIGFGGTLMAIPIASKIIGMEKTVLVLAIVVLLASLFIAIRDFKHIAIKHYFKITTLMLIGLPVGMWLFAMLPERLLKVALGIFMIYMAVKELFLKKGSSARNEAAATLIFNEKKKFSFKNIITNITLFTGGVIHGAFTCGGPFVVVYATQNIKDKNSFRATLCALWATLNSIFLVLYYAQGKITKEILTITGITMPFVLVAIFIANIIHKKVNGNQFGKFVYIALFISGILMML